MRPRASLHPLLSPKMARIFFTWSLRRSGNDGYVLEECGPHWRHEFGPMPPHAVRAFAEARRRLIATYMERLGADYVLDDPEQFFRDATSRNSSNSKETTDEDETGIEIDLTGRH